MSNRCVDNFISDEKILMPLLCNPIANMPMISAVDFIYETILNIAITISINTVTPLFPIKFINYIIENIIPVELCCMNTV